MRFRWLMVVCVLTLMTSAAYRPLLDTGFGLADPVMVMIAWFSLSDRLSRIFVALAVVSAVRIWLGIAELPDTVIPLLGIVITVRCLRLVLDPFHPMKRFQILLPAFLCGLILQRVLVVGSVAGAGYLMFFSVIFTALVAALLLPILDLVSPLLRSARYPL
ncbi:MAG: hypothetical protein AAEJ04_08475 [Planctomycetota bacterium]